MELRECCSRLPGCQVCFRVDHDHGGIGACLERAQRFLTLAQVGPIVVDEEFQRIVVRISVIERRIRAMIRSHERQNVLVLQTLVHPHEIVKAVEKCDMMHAHAGGHLFGACGIVKDCQAMVSQIEGVKTPKAIYFEDRVDAEEGAIERSHLLEPGSFQPNVMQLYGRNASLVEAVFLML